MRFRKTKKSEATHHIDVTPLIDMVFFLLIFFMVSSSFTKEMKVELDRPGAGSGQPASSKSVRVYIDKFGEIHLDGLGIRLWALQAKVKDLLASSEGKSVLVISDKNVPVERLIEVVDQCRFAGARDVGVAAKHEDGQSS